MYESHTFPSKLFLATVLMLFPQCPVCLKICSHIKVLLTFSLPISQGPRLSMSLCVFRAQDCISIASLSLWAVFPQDLIMCAYTATARVALHREGTLAHFLGFLMRK